MQYGRAEMVKAKFPLPSVVNPSERVSVCVPVPDDPGHRQAFLGAIYSLARARSWADDPAFPAKPVADVWAAIWADVSDQLAERTGCGMPFDVRQNEESPCSLEKTSDGETWEQFADLSLCESGTPVYSAPGGGIVISDGGDGYIPPSNIPDTFDPRSTHVRLVRPQTDAEIKCLATANAANVLYRLHSEVRQRYTLASGLSALAILSFCLGIVGMGAWGVLAILAAPAYSVVAISFLLAADAFNGGVMRALECILYTNATVSGGVCSFDYAAVLSAVRAKQTIGYTIWHALDYYLQIIGADGLNMAGDTTAISSTCCDFCGTSTQTTRLYFQTSQNRYGEMLFSGTNGAPVTWDASYGYRLTIPSTGNGAFQFTFQTPPDCEIVTLGVYCQGSRDGLDYYLDLNGVRNRTWTGISQFGAFEMMSNTVSLNGLIRFGFPVQDRAGAATFTFRNMVATYKGCDPFAYYR